MEDRIKDIFKNIQEDDEEQNIKKTTFIDMESGQQRTLIEKLHEEQKDGWRGIKKDILHFFKTSPTKLNDTEAKKLKVISDWAFSEGRSLDEGLQKLRSLEIELGMPRGKKEDRWDKIFIHVQMEKQINDLRKQQKALER
ncbi:MAG: hypothetical protein PHY73_02075 [Candidatus Omnitrophica bacterium]|nr:hypothetical protein [Candidatus Omnitrophota bacterium]